VIPAWEATKLTQVTGGYTKSQKYTQKWGNPPVNIGNCFQVMAKEITEKQIEFAFIFGGWSTG
jgi:hypothetical protein